MKLSNIIFYKKQTNSFLNGIVIESTYFCRYWLKKGKKVKISAKKQCPPPVNYDFDTGHCIITGNIK